ncbi:MAG: hexose kinase [Vicinamibacterales bacterium]|jgi:tagatose 6-phosphate kinase|nr:1-phosphofructokinase [Acidobacteriota bacterium]MDP6373665.1 hexose kinase [Vicinamibacterales bacterium]MDP6609793.1 hexose kinase [Vicinamibacterales bacterium]|tara:strand:- start:1053 stop:1988 length:936 start_codon:yes stop_codon:yes gene_type:complete
MITVAGFNTSIDHWFKLDRLEPGGVLRVESVGAAPGGKGLHVALTCAALDEEVRLVGIIDAEHGGYFSEFLHEAGVTFQGVEVGGEVRGCVAIHERDGRTTELLEPGPELDDVECGALDSSVHFGVGRTDVVAFAGSVPRGYPGSAYAELIARVRAADARTIVDASDELLRSAIAAAPDLVKVNRDEAAELTGRAIGDAAEAMAAAGAIREQGAGAALVTLGGGGAVLATDAGGWTLSVPEGLEVKSAVGAGDCLLGGVAVAIARRLPWDEVLRLGGACGTAKTQRVETGLLHRADIEAMQEAIEVTRWAA